jgi:hypothetical protein
VAGLAAGYSGVGSGTRREGVLGCFGSGGLHRNRFEFGPAASSHEEDTQDDEGDDGDTSNDAAYDGADRSGGAGGLAGRGDRGRGGHRGEWSESGGDFIGQDGLD